MTLEDDVGTGLPRVAARRTRENAREILVVALGILIAFGVDAWWGGYQERQEADGLLTTLAEELRSNAAGLRRSAGRHQSLAQAGFGLLQVTGPDPDPGTSDHALDLVTQFWLSPRGQIQATALTTSLEAGAVARLADAELRGALAELPGRYDRLDALEGRIGDLVEQRIFPLLWLHLPQLNVELATGFGGEGPLYEEFRASAPSESDFPSNVRGLLSDLTFENVVVERTTLLMFGRSSSEELARRLEDLASQLEDAR